MSNPAVVRRPPFVIRRSFSRSSSINNQINHNKDNSQDKDKIERDIKVDDLLNVMDYERTGIWKLGVMTVPEPDLKVR